MPRLPGVRARRREERRLNMDNWTFGLTMMVVAMGGTFLTLWLLGLIIDLLKKIYPLRSDSGDPQRKS